MYLCTELLTNQIQNIMKRILTIAMTCLVVCVLAACGGKNGSVSKSDSPSDVDRYDAETGEMKIKREGVDIPALFEYFTENVDEKHECWENDGGEGLSEAAESDNGVCFVLAYKLWENINYYYQYLIMSFIK